MDKNRRAGGLHEIILSKFYEILYAKMYGIDFIELAAQLIYNYFYEIFPRSETVLRLLKKPFVAVISDCVTIQVN